MPRFHKSGLPASSTCMIVVDVPSVMRSILGQKPEWGLPQGRMANRPPSTNWGKHGEACLAVPKFVPHAAADETPGDEVVAAARTRTGGAGQHHQNGRPPP